MSSHNSESNEKGSRFSNQTLKLTRCKKHQAFGKILSLWYHQEYGGDFIG